MKTIGNIIWLLLAGIWLFISYVIAGVIMCLLIITIPFGIQSFKLAVFSLWPFGRTAVQRPGGSGAASGCGNVLWFILGGWWIVIVHAVTALLLCIPIITIPLALQNLKIAGLALAPFGKEIVRTADLPGYYARAAQVIAPGPAAATPAQVQYSADGQYWWDGSAWRPVGPR